MIGLFVFGTFITALVGLACWLIVTGIRADQRERQQLSEPRGSGSDIS